jgi:hypothetical protein
VPSPAATDGFRVQGLAPGAYVLRTARLGYAPRLRAFTVSEPGQRVDLDTVQLTRVAAKLSEVSVGASAAAMTVEPDRNSYRAKDVAPGAANASEVLEVVPSVQVDADGKVSLRGNENVVVQINGRPTPLRGQQLAAFLKQLPGPVVERVEVVPSPSAKYDPEGLGGIINIVLKQDADLGTSGGVTVQGMNAGRWNGSGNVGHQQGRATLFASYGFNIDERAFSGINDRERYGPARVFSSATDQDLTGTTLNRGHNVTANFDWRATRRDVLSQAAVVNVRASGEDSRLAVHRVRRVARGVRPVPAAAWDARAWPPPRLHRGLEADHRPAQARAERRGARQPHARRGGQPVHPPQRRRAGHSSTARPTTSTRAPRSSRRSSTTRAPSARPPSSRPGTAATRAGSTASSTRGATTRGAGRGRRARSATASRSTSTCRRPTAW